jgi:hypothetical protein
MRSHEMSRDAEVVSGETVGVTIYILLLVYISPHKGCKPTYTITTISTISTSITRGYQEMRCNDKMRSYEMR